MKQLSYKKGSLFQAAKPGAILVHACNAEGSWGAGIALQFKKKYPKAYKDYSDWCQKDPEELVGSYLNLKDSELTITCLFTSSGYGERKDTRDEIILNTVKSIKDFIMTVPYKGVINSPKINAGLFKIPWKDTEKIIKGCLELRPDVSWVVWEV
jgi:ADP-ribose 1''-phosphate phosphatase